MNVLKIVLIVILFSLVSINAQTFGGSLQLAYPHGEFKENVDRMAYGFQLQGTIWSPNKLRPVTLGLTGGFITYGEEKTRRPLSTTIPDVTVDVSRSNNIANLGLLLMISPFQGTWRPYLEGIVGGAYMYTSSEVSSQFNNNSVFEDVNKDDLTWNAGVGGGFLIKVSKDNDNDIYLDIKTRYLWGGTAEYLKEGSVQIVNGQALYDVKKSKTNMWNLHIGVLYYMNR